MDEDAARARAAASTQAKGSKRTLPVPPVTLAKAVPGKRPKQAPATHVGQTSIRSAFRQQSAAHADQDMDAKGDIEGSNPRDITRSIVDQTLPRSESNTHSVLNQSPLSALSASLQPAREPRQSRRPASSVPALSSPPLSFGPLAARQSPLSLSVLSGGQSPLSLSSAASPTSQSNQSPNAPSGSLASQPASSL